MILPSSNPHRRWGAEPPRRRFLPTVHINGGRQPPLSNVVPSLGGGTPAEPPRNPPRASEAAEHPKAKQQTETTSTNHKP